MNGIQAPIDYKTVPPLPQAKTVTAVNNFVISTTQFLNKFSYLCESKLEEVHKNLQRLEITLNILEAKLSSIPGLEGNVPPATTSQSSAPPQQQQQLLLQQQTEVNRIATSQEHNPGSDTETTVGESQPPPPSSAKPIKVRIFRKPDSFCHTH